MGSLRVVLDTHVWLDWLVFDDAGGHRRARQRSRLPFRILTPLELRVALVSGRQELAHISGATAR